MIMKTAPPAAKLAACLGKSANRHQSGARCHGLTYERRLPQTQRPRQGTSENGSVRSTITHTSVIRCTIGTGEPITNANSIQNWIHPCSPAPPLLVLRPAVAPSPLPAGSGTGVAPLGGERERGRESDSKRERNPTAKQASGRLSLPRLVDAILIAIPTSPPQSLRSPTAYPY
jgi:hypothetical protein